MQKNNTLITAPALALIATLLTALPCRGAEAVSSRPQLVLSIVIDGLRADYLEMLSECFGPDGFNRLMAEGVVIDEVDFGPGVDAAGATAILYTGAEPAVNGVASAATYNVERHIETPTLLDPSKIGNYTTETLSPAAIRVSTLADEVRIDGAGASYAHAIAPDASRAIIMGGHAGNSAFWLNDINGQWATTTHYREVPTAVTARNYSAPLSLRVDTIRWTPSLPLDRYPALPAQKRKYPFEHYFFGSDPNKFRLFKKSAPVNREVTDLATQYLSDMRLGNRDAIDMLSVGYTLAPYPGSHDADARLETMDAYVKLDRELARLLNAARADGGNTVVVVAGTPALPSTTADDASWQLPGGEFSARKALSLLNMYLIACHGNGEWVTAYHDGAFYLNRQLIEEKHINAEELRTEAAKFLMRMTGVAGAHTIDDILEGRRQASERRNTVVATAPDVFVDVIPGWTLVDDFESPDSPVRSTVRVSGTTAPVIFFAPGRIEARRVDTPVDARRVAPTVARLLRIRSPNAAAQPALPQVFTLPVTKTEK